MSVWVTAAVLQALAEQQLAAGAQFTVAQLDAWLAERITGEQRVHATTRLVGLGMLRHQVAVDTELRRVDRYTVTDDGAEAIAAAAAGHVRKSGPKVSRRPNPHQPGSLVVRLWQLVRLRRIVDSDSAAATLCDAGGDFTRVQATVRKYLRRWADAGALEEGKRRVGGQGTSNGTKRYVLREAWQGSVEPPAWREIQRQRAQEAQA